MQKSVKLGLGLFLLVLPVFSQDHSAAGGNSKRTVDIAPMPRAVAPKIPPVVKKEEESAVFHLGMLNCSRKTPLTAPSQLGWGDIQNLNFFEKVGVNPEGPNEEMKGLAMVSLYPRKTDSGTPETSRLLVNYQFTLENGLTGKISVPPFINPTGPIVLNLPKFDPNAEYPGDIEATLQFSAKEPLVPATCRFPQLK